MGEIHDRLEALTKTRPYRTWAAVSPTDARKVELELAGQRRPTAGSAYARELIGLARLDPPGITPPTPTLAEVWRRDGVFVRVLSNFHGDLRQAARAARFSWLAIQLDHSPYAAANEQELAAIGTALRGQGWTLTGWGTAGQGTDPADDARRHATIVRKLGLAGWIANLELWAEATDIWKTGSYLRAWNDTGAPCPLAVSCMSSTTPNWARNFDYPSWLAQPGAAVMPQVYGASNPAYTVANGVATMGKGGVPTDRLALTFDIIAGQGPFADYSTWPGPRSVYAGEDTTVATWKQLAR